MRPRQEFSFEEAARVRVEPFIRFANYYETDQMQIIHHANYVHWMEEARVDMMEKIGFGYAKMESMGILCPVLGIRTDYKAMVRFNERVSIECRIAEYNGLKLTILYRMTKLPDGEVCTLCESRHGFHDAEGHIISLKKSYPEIHQLILDSMIKEEKEN